MQINPAVNQAINKQIGMEFGAYLQYLTISTHFDVEGLSELAAFFKAQAEDERDHAERFINHVVAFNGKLEIPTIDAPSSDVKTIEEAAQLSLDWEMKVTDEINALLKLASNEGGPHHREFPVLVPRRATRGTVDHEQTLESGQARRRQ